MSHQMTGEETRAHHIDLMGPELGTIYHELWNEVVWAHAKWREFQDLYFAESTVKILNRTAPFYFSLMQDVLHREILLHLCRLTDRPQSAGRLNLALAQLENHIPDPELNQRVKEKAEIARVRTGFARSWRNRHLAHRDLHQALGNVEPLPPPTGHHIDVALESIGDVLNEVIGHYEKSKTNFKGFPIPEGAQSVVAYLRLGLTVDPWDQRRRNDEPPAVE